MMCVIFLLSRFFSISLINDNVVLNEIYTALSKIVVLAIMIKYFFIRHSISPFVICVLIYYSLLLFTTILCDGSIQRVFMTMYPVVGMCLFIEIKTDHASVDLFKAFAYLLTILAAINFVLMLTVSVENDYSVTTYLLGGRNQLALSLIIALVSLYVITEKYGKTMLFHICVIIFAITILLSRSANNIVAVGLIIAYLYVPTVKNFVQKVGLGNSIIGYIALWSSLVLFKLQELFSFLIVDILNRDITFTNRTYIWDIVLNDFSQKPFLGHGVRDTVNLFYLYLVRVNKPTVDKYFSAHNQILQTLYEGGIIAMVPLCALILICIKKIHYVNNAKITGFLTISIIALLVIMLAEAPGWDSLIIVLALAYNLPKVQKYSN